MRPVSILLFQLTHPTRGATSHSEISIAFLFISTHTPHTGCDTFNTENMLYRLRFQLTHPTRGATSRYVFDDKLLVFQLTHPTRGATLHIEKIESPPPNGVDQNNHLYISVHKVPKYTIISTSNLPFPTSFGLRRGQIIITPSGL